MLCLTRYLGETIVIGGQIVVTILSADRGKVVLGVEGPREIPVHRGEVQDRIEAGEERKPRGHVP